MVPLPEYRPKRLSLGPLEAEILNIIWELGSVTVKVDPLLLAESLLLVVSSQPTSTDICCAALDSSGTDRLEQRIEALLKSPENYSQFQENSWNSFLLAFLPLVSILFHT